MQFHRQAVFYSIEVISWTNQTKTSNPARGEGSLHVFEMSKAAHEYMIGQVFQVARIEKPSKQSLGHVRHTGGTALAVKYGPDVARQALGHTRDSRVFETHYFDRRQLKDVAKLNWWEP